MFYFVFIFNSMILSILLLPKSKHAKVGAFVRDTTIAKRREPYHGRLTAWHSQAERVMHSIE
jgi:hypothetical protein